MSYNLTSDAEKQTEEAKNLARARQSLIEELDAINVYEAFSGQQRRRIKENSAHNRDEEKEHAAIWLNI